jgi:hypothetical protein
MTANIFWPAWYYFLYVEFSAFYVSLDNKLYHPKIWRIWTSCTP